MKALKMNFLFLRLTYLSHLDKTVFSFFIFRHNSDKCVSKFRSEYIVISKILSNAFVSNYSISLFDQNLLKLTAWYQKIVFTIIHLHVITFKEGTSISALFSNFFKVFSMVCSQTNGHS